MAKERSILNEAVNAIQAMAQDPKNKNKSPLKIFLDYLSSNPEVKDQKEQLVAVATKAKSAVRDSKVETKDKPLDLSIPKQLPKKEEAAFQEDIKNIRKLKPPLKASRAEKPVKRDEKPVKPDKKPLPKRPVENRNTKKQEQPPQDSKKSFENFEAGTASTSNAPTKKEDNIISKAVDAVGGVLTGVGKGISSIVSGDFKADVPTKGTPEYEAYISSDPRAMNPDVKDLKKGGKVTKKKKKKASYGKKYSMNRGGKVASLRKPTRA